MSFLFIWVRGTLLRFSYDRFTCFAWRIFLPLSLDYVLFFVGVGLGYVFYFFFVLFFNLG